MLGTLKTACVPAIILGLLVCMVKKSKSHGGYMELKA